MSFRYIGSKARLVGAIAEHIGFAREKDGRFVDAFCGTGIVAQTAAKQGWSVWLNDHLVSAGIVAASRLISKKEVTFDYLGGYERAIALLNELPPVEGYFWREYSPASIETAGIERRYFTTSNAGRLDAMRMQIQEWRRTGQLHEVEERLLLGDLMAAANRVANTAGTYGCFLAKWTNQATDPVWMVPRELANETTPVEITSQDVQMLEVKPNDLVYLDPPYTKRQYAAYYHMLETIALYDEPVVQGVAGLRPWQEKASEFCYRKRALPALVSLIENLTARRILLSYSEDGHIKLDQLTQRLMEFGQVRSYPLMNVGRYRSTPVAKSNGSVREYLFVIEKDGEAMKKEAVI